ncbi:MAG TPA: CCA tRNA nucleotidyltransferase [Chloroflexi bacterium]|jgi:tRNA nucleotidyltransferase/poly(A) polymerase|nr:CCA tRNA nucleotidyltransferase [Chloroflexota bacterium]
MNSRAVREWLAAEPVFREAAVYLCHQGIAVYLVGGTVRDLLVGRPSYDMDLAVGGDALGLARRLADAIGGAFVPMDPARDVARVVVRRTGEERLIDVARLRAGTIDEDLRARDYTANALAIPLCNPEQGVLDPTGGRADLEAQTLRATHAGAFDDDPLRLLRGVRLRAALGWSIAPETERLMRTWAPALRRVSPERVRDELMQILALEDAADGLAYAHALGLLTPALPLLEGAALDVGIRRVAALERLEPLWSASGAPPSALPDVLRQHLRTYWREALSAGRTRWMVTKLAALLEPRLDVAGSTAEGLRLSVREVRLVAGAVEAAHQLREDGWTAPPSPLAIYRYFRRAGEAGVAGALLSWAAAGGADEVVPGAVTSALVRAWFEEHRQVVNPPPLLTGGEVMAELGLAPGPRVGRALEALREAQVQGLVRTAAEARAYLREAERG